MRIPICMILYMIVLSAVTVKAADEPLSQEDTLKELAGDLAKLELLVQETNYNIQEFQKTQISSLEPRNLTITSQKAVIYKGVGEDTSKLTTVGQGKSFQIIDKEGDWYKVSLDEPVQGQTTGWIRSEEILPFFGFNPISGASIRAYIELMFNEILETALWIKEKYKNNEYVYIPGFRLGFPPQVQVEVLFKDEKRQ